MNVIVIIYYLILLAASLIGLVRYKKLTIPFKFLAVNVTLTFFLAIVDFWFSSRYKNNIPITHIVCITEFILYSLVYYYLIKSRTIKKIILVLIFLTTIFFIVNATFLQPFFKAFPSYAILTSETLYVIFSLFLFKQMLLYPVQINITKQSVFWYNTAMLFFSTTMFLNLGFINYYSEHHIHDAVIYYFWYLADFIFYILIGISLLIDNKEITTNNA